MRKLASDRRFVSRFARNYFMSKVGRLVELHEPFQNDGDEVKDRILMAVKSNYPLLLNFKLVRLLGGFSFLRRGLNTDFSPIKREIQTKLKQSISSKELVSLVSKDMEENPDEYELNSRDIARLNRQGVNVLSKIKAMPEKQREKHLSEAGKDFFKSALAEKIKDYIDPEQSRSTADRERKKQQQTDRIITKVIDKLEGTSYTREEALRMLHSALTVKNLPIPNEDSLSYRSFLRLIDDRPRNLNRDPQPRNKGQEESPQELRITQVVKQFTRDHKIQLEKIKEALLAKAEELTQEIKISGDQKEEMLEKEYLRLVKSMGLENYARDDNSVLERALEDTFRQAYYIMGI